MCYATTSPPTLACTIGDMPAGTKYRDNYGTRYLVTDFPRGVDSTTVANLRTGQIGPVYSDTKLGRDDNGRLYTSTFLNEWHYDAPGQMTLSATEADPGRTADGSDMGM